MAKYEEVSVHGYEEFCNAVSERKGKDVFVYFSGDKDEQGTSWCPDCVKGENFIADISGFLMEIVLFSVHVERLYMSMYCNATSLYLINQDIIISKSVLIKQQL